MYLVCHGPDPFTDTAIYLQEQYHLHVLTHKKSNGVASQQTVASFDHIATHGAVLIQINANQLLGKGIIPKDTAIYCLILALKANVASQQCYSFRWWNKQHNTYYGAF